jgi:hypothetical protein
MNDKTVQGSWGRKPLKRLCAACRQYTALKRGVNESGVYESSDGFPKPAADGLAPSPPFSRPCGLRYSQILFATSQVAQIPLCGNALPRKAGSTNLTSGMPSSEFGVGYPEHLFDMFGQLWTATAEVQDRKRGNFTRFTRFAV